MSCITSNQTMSTDDAQAADADASGVSFYVRVDAVTPQITISFTGCSSISVTPTPASPPGTTSVTFKTDDIGTEFELDFQFARELASEPSPIVTPTTKPKFKPVGTCP